MLNSVVVVGKLSIRKNDQVQVIAGREKGKVGKVLSVDHVKGRVVVEKTNMMKKHVKPNQKNPQGGVIEKEIPLHYSNVLLYCTKCSKGVRHGSKMTEKAAKGKKGAEKKATKVRVCKKCDSSLEATA
ncbi:50S ribosomal protein L24 [bacterium]|jgi:large subunit ribosomal protein L24|nr:50S ribosomal protein L24 [bacterium]